MYCVFYIYLHPGSLSFWLGSKFEMLGAQLATEAKCESLSLQESILFTWTTDTCKQTTSVKQINPQKEREKKKKKNNNNNLLSLGKRLRYVNN